MPITMADCTNDNVGNSGPDINESPVSASSVDDQTSPLEEDDMTNELPPEDTLPDLGLPIGDSEDIHRVYQNVLCQSFVFEMHFSPIEDSHIIAVSLVTGELVLYRYDTDHCSSEFSSIKELHKKSCRSFSFFPCGHRIVSGSADKYCVVSNTDGSIIWRKKIATEGGVSAVMSVNDDTFISGNESGNVRVWDIRQRSSALSVAEFTNYESWISKIVLLRDSSYFAAICDGSFTVYDIRNISRAVQKYQSDEFSSDINSLAEIRGGANLISGDAKGLLRVFSWGNFSSSDNAISVCPRGVVINDTAVLEDDTVVVACSDGLLRLVSLFPNKVSGTLGEVTEDVDSIEALSCSPDGDVFASYSADQIIRFYSTSSAIDIAEADTANISKRQKTMTSSNRFFDLL